MPKFAANLSMLFTEVPFMERFSLAKKEGFTAIEYLFPYTYDVAELKGKLETNGLKQVLFNLPAGDWANGERGIAANPEKTEEFRLGVGLAIKYAQELGVTQLNCLAGKRLSIYNEIEQWKVLVENVHYAGTELKKAGINLVIEPINHFDISGFFLNRTEQVIKLINEVDVPNVFIQYDIYHAQREEGEITATLRANIDKIGHIQIADNPGRHQPGTGEINYPYIFKELDTLGYKGYIGLEYVPSPNSQESLGWITDYGYKL